MYISRVKIHNQLICFFSLLNLHLRMRQPLPIVLTLARIHGPAGLTEVELRTACTRRLRPAEHDALLADGAVHVCAPVVVFEDRC